MLDSIPPWSLEGNNYGMMLQILLQVYVYKITYDDKAKDQVL